MIKHAQRIKKGVNKLYHLSDDNNDGKVFRPRIPDSVCDDEDTTYRRVCFSSTLSGAFRAISFSSYYSDVMYVHTPVDTAALIDKGCIYKPDEKLVPDVYFTNEYWCRCPVRLKCIGKAHFIYSRNKHNTKRPPVKIRWIERY